MIIKDVKYYKRMERVFISLEWNCRVLYFFINEGLIFVYFWVIVLEFSKVGNLVYEKEFNLSFIDILIVYSFIIDKFSYLLMFIWKRKF